MLINSCGAIFYKRENNKLKLLIVENKGKYEDIGIQIDDTNNIFHLLGLAIEDCTNGKIKNKDIIERLEKASYIYIPRFKYIVYFIEATNNEKQLKKEDFYDKSNKSIGWITRDNLCCSSVIKYKINYRLKTKLFFDKLIHIENKYKYKKNMFITKNNI